MTYSLNSNEGLENISLTEKDFFEIFHLSHHRRSPLPDSVDPGGRFIFNTFSHLYTQTEGEIESFIVKHRETGSLLAEIHFTVNARSELVSLERAPFGGVQLYSDLSILPVRALIRFVSDWAAQRRLEALVVKMAPEAYVQPLYEEQVATYLENGFELASGMENLHIQVSDALFENTISRQEVKRLRKCQEAGCYTRSISSSELTSLYPFIERSRRKQGYPLLYPPQLLSGLADTFPDQLLLFGVYQGDELISMAVTIRVNQHILYNFLPVDNPDYRYISPSVMLTGAIYRYCQDNGIQLLDLGISVNEQGRVKPSLLRFKRNIGGITSVKSVFRKQLRVH